MMVRTTTTVTPVAISTGSPPRGCAAGASPARYYQGGRWMTRRSSAQCTAGIRVLGVSDGAVVLLVALGGAVGALLRWGLEAWVQTGGGDHAGTLLVNVLGCLLMGVLLTWRRLPSVP